MADETGRRVYSSYIPAYSHDQAFVGGNPLLDRLSPAFVIQNYLAGLPLVATATSQDLRGIVQQKIDAAVGDFERDMEAFIVPRRIISNVVGQTPQKIESVSGEGAFYGEMNSPAIAGVDYDMLEEPYDYTSRRFETWGTVKTHYKPILSIQNIVYALPPNFGILIVPQPWITAYPLSGIVKIVPVEGAMAVTSPGAGMWLPFFTMGRMNHVPQFQQISYTAGIDLIGDDLIDALAMLAASKVLEVYNMAYYPGIQSFSHSVDGFNQSVTLRSKGPFSDQIADWRKQAKDWVNSWRKANSGIAIASLGR